MDPSCLQYCMTEAQRDHFEQQGYLIVEDALDDNMLGRLLEAGDRVDAPEMERPQPRLSLKVGFWLTDITEPERGGKVGCSGTGLQPIVTIERPGYSH